MGNYFKGWFSIVAILILLLGVISGCSSSQAGGKDHGSIDPKKNTAIKDGKFVTDVKMTVARQLDADAKFAKGDSLNNNPFTRFVKKTLGIDMEFSLTAPDFDTLKQQLQLKMASNQKLPDVISSRMSADFNSELVNSGKFMPVGDLFDKYASPALKAAYDQAPDTWYPFMNSKGEKIGIPQLDYAMNQDSVLWIRTDWLKKLNLKAPKTIDDMEKVMDAFVNQDPDGDGKSDTFGLAIGAKNAWNTWMSSANFVFGAYGAMPNQWNKADDGTLVNGSIQPGVKKGLSTLRDWMAKGYISSQAGLVDEVKAAEAFTSGKAGMIAAPHYAGDWPLNDTKKNVKGATYKAFPLPKGPNGQAGRSTSPPYNGCLLINKNMEHPEAVILLLNWMYDHLSNPEKGSKYQYGLAEGYNYVMKDGKVSYAGADFPGGKAPAATWLTYDVARIPNLYMKTMNGFANGAKPKSPYEKKLSTQFSKSVYDAGAVVWNQKDIEMKNYFLGAPTETMQKRGSYLDKMKNETFNKIIYGKKPLDSFDKFVSQWKSSGGNQITKEVNKWYKSVGSK